MSERRWKLVGQTGGTPLIGGPALEDGEVVEVVEAPPIRGNHNFDWETLTKLKVTNPVQLAILGILRDGSLASPNIISGKLRLPLGNVSYHVAVLRDKGCISLKREVPRRGAVEHFYAVEEKVFA